MRTKLWLGVILSTSALAACGGGGGDADAPVAAIDAPGGTPDAPRQPDADPNQPDAAMGAFSCLGVPIPTTAPATLTVGGTMGAIGLAGTTPIEGATVSGYIVGNNTAVATATTGTGGAYSISITNPGSAPVNGYLSAPSAGNKTVYLFPPTPLYQDVPMAPLRTITNNVFGVFLAVSQASVAAGNGVVALVVTDCLGNPLQGATVSSPNSTVIRYNGADGLPKPYGTGMGQAAATAVDGVAYVIDVPAGNATVDALYQGMDLREHTVIVHPADGADNAITTTTVAP